MVFYFKMIVFIYDGKNSYRAMIVIDLLVSIDCILKLKEVFNDYFVAMFTKTRLLTLKIKLELKFCGIFLAGNIFESSKNVKCFTI